MAISTGRARDAASEHCTQLDREPREDIPR
jgi:hypothetical protein